MKNNLDRGGYTSKIVSARDCELADALPPERKEAEKRAKEYLARLLYYSEGAQAKRLADGLIDDLGTLDGLFDMPTDELISGGGLAERTAVLLKLAVYLGGRIRRGDQGAASRIVPRIFGRGAVYAAYRREGQAFENRMLRRGCCFLVRPVPEKTARMCDKKRCQRGYSGAQPPKRHHRALERRYIYYENAGEDIFLLWYKIARALRGRGQGGRRGSDRERLIFSSILEKRYEWNLYLTIFLAR